MTKSGDSLKTTEIELESGDRLVEFTEVEDQECAEFQALMPERIGAGEDLQFYPHMLTCERCRALVRDLEYIAAAAKQLIPIEEEPREDLWAQIQLAIERGDA
ncbi:MAG TPA: hypothetical protein VIM62_00740 [Acidobacteriaceae bacterium]